MGLRDLNRNRRNQEPNSVYVESLYRSIPFTLNKKSHGRFMLFAFNKYVPSGGMSDLKLVFDDENSLLSTLDSIVDESLMDNGVFIILDSFYNAELKFESKKFTKEDCISTAVLMFRELVNKVKSFESPNMSEPSNLTNDGSVLGFKSLSKDEVKKLESYSEGTLNTVPDYMVEFIDKKIIDKAVSDALENYKLSDEFKLLNKRKIDRDRIVRALFCRPEEKGEVETLETTPSMEITVEEEIPVEEEILVEEEIPTEIEKDGEVPSIGESVEELSSDDEIPTEEETDDVIIVEEIPVEEETEELTEDEEIPTEIETDGEEIAGEELTIDEEIPTEIETDEETIVKEEIPTEEETSISEEISVEEEIETSNVFDNCTKKIEDDLNPVVEEEHIVEEIPNKEEKVPSKEELISNMLSAHRNLPMKSVKDVVVDSIVSIVNCYDKNVVDLNELNLDATVSSYLVNIHNNLLKYLNTDFNSGKLETLDLRIRNISEWVNSGFRFDFIEEDCLEYKDYLNQIISLISCGVNFKDVAELHKGLCSNYDLLKLELSASKKFKSIISFAESNAVLNCNSVNSLFSLELYSNDFDNLEKVNNLNSIVKEEKEALEKEMESKEIENSSVFGYEKSPSMNEVTSPSMNEVTSPSMNSSTEDLEERDKWFEEKIKPINGKLDEITLLLNKLMSDKKV